MPESKDIPGLLHRLHYAHICNVSQQPGCLDSWQMWSWYAVGNQYFAKFVNGKIMNGGKRFCDQHYRDITIIIWSSIEIRAWICDGRQFMMHPWTYEHVQCTANRWQLHCNTRWRRQMDTFSAVLSLCAGNSPVTGESPAQKPVTRSFDVFFDLCLNKRLSKQSWGWWFETSSRPL